MRVLKLLCLLCVLVSGCSLSVKPPPKNVVDRFYDADGYWYFEKGTWQWDKGYWRDDDEVGLIYLLSIPVYINPH